MATTPITSTPSQAQPNPTRTASGASNTSQGSPSASAATNSSATTTGKSDNDKVSLSDTATKLLAANKKVNPDGTVGPHHKPRHPQAATKPV